MISNLQITKVHNPDGWAHKFKCWATVDIETESGFWIWKKTKTETREIYKAAGMFWIFSDTGEYTDGREVENLQKVLEAQTGVDLLDLKHTVESED